MRGLILASRSARRRQLLIEAGFEFDALPSPVDDSELRPGGGSAREWVVGLAYLKARGLVEAMPTDSVVLGSDTVVVKAGEIIGQPADEADARRIIELLSDGSHEVVTGVALIVGASRRLFVDSARVTVGTVTQEQVRAYLATGGWRGKAGAYNLSERIADGWPLECAGDPTCVMGLPMKRLTPMLRRLLEKDQI